MPKKSLDELYEELQRYHKFKFKQILHVKIGSMYRIKDIFFKEEDMSIWFSYNSMEHLGVTFSRPIEKLLEDDRFKIQ